MRNANFRVYPFHSHIVGLLLLSCTSELVSNLNDINLATIRIILQMTCNQNWNVLKGYGCITALLHMSRNTGN